MDKVKDKDDDAFLAYLPETKRQKTIYVPLSELHETERDLFDDILQNDVDVSNSTGTIASTINDISSEINGKFCRRRI